MILFIIKLYTRNDTFKHPERISNIKPFITKYNWKDIDFLSGSKDWIKFEQNNKTIVLNLLFVPRNTEEIRLAYKSEHNIKRGKKVILLIISDSEKCHYLFDCKKFPCIT